MEVYKVIVVEDIEIILESVVSLVKSYNNLYEICATASDGLEAIEAINNNKPHVVITDIRMPNLDGIELIRRIKEVDRDIKFIILSGYAEFEYAQEAMRLGVSRYLLKPIKEDELFAALDSAVYEIEEENKKSFKINRSVIIEKEKNRLEIERVLNELIFTEFDSSNAEDFCRRTGQNTVSTYYAMLFVRISNLSHYESPFEEGESSLVRVAVRNVITEMCADETSSIVYFNSKNVNRCYVLLYGEKEADLVGKTGVLAYDIYNNIKTYIKINITIGISSVVMGIAGIKQVFDQAGKALEYRFINGCGKVYNYNPRDFQVENTIVMLSQNLEALQRCFQYPDKNKILQSARSILQDIFSCENIKHNPGTYINLHFTEIIIKIVGLAKILGVNNINFIENSVFTGEIISPFDSCEEITDFLCNVINKVIELSQPVDDGLLNIESVKDYIDTNYAGSIYLVDVADRFSVTPKHISKVFKRKYGVNFVDYINGLRMEKAKELLKSTALGIDGISETLGFNDRSYFFKLFRKYTGTTPLEFRLNNEK